MDILVTGARGVVGAPLCEALSARGDRPVKASRKESDDTLLWDLQGNKKPKLENIQTLFHCAPIWLLPKHIAFLAKSGVKRIIAFSSTSVFSKQVSENPGEQELVSLLIKAENKLPELCRKHKIKLTIFRPTMIYGYGRDQNISRIAGFIRRFKFAMIVGEASGQRQPVHADDLVDAVFKAENARKTYGKAYNLSGKESMAYKEMVQRIFKAQSIKERIISCPLWLMRLVLIVAARLSSFAYTADMANRMNQDLSYDSSKAMNDFEYSPQPFLQNPQRDLIKANGRAVK